MQDSGLIRRTVADVSKLVPYTIIMVPPPLPPPQPPPTLHPNPTPPRYTLTLHPNPTPPRYTPTLHRASGPRLPTPSSRRQVIPMSPPGHVFAFSVLNRVFPNAVPSAFTAQRQDINDIYTARRPPAPPPPAPSSPPTRPATRASVRFALTSPHPSNRPSLTPLTPSVVCAAHCGRGLERAKAPGTQRAPARHHRQGLGARLHTQARTHAAQAVGGPCRPGVRRRRDGLGSPDDRCAAPAVCMWPCISIQIGVNE